MRAEELSGSTDWGATSAAFRDLLTEWKAAGRAAKDVDDALWQRFKAAQDTFFAARNAVTAERDAELQRQRHRQGGAARRGGEDRHRPTTTPRARRCGRSPTSGTRIGKVPRERTDLERRLRAVEKKVRDAAEAERADPQAQARAEQFPARAEQFEKQAAKAEAAGRTKEAEEARANAEQWRQWADAAASALTRKR